MRVRMILGLLVCSFLIATPLFAQGTRGILRGTVESEGAALPGVSVTIASPALQGTRTTVTDAIGNYIFPALPPGVYELSFQLEGMETVTREATVSLNQTTRINAEMSLSAISEVLNVSAEASVLETSEMSQNFTAEVINQLPVNRTIRGATELAPGISTEGPNDQVMISGAPSYESLYLVNGAVVNENLRGQPQSVFIEDAISQTTVITGNISAEYGRFTGGVVSAITKQGGNEFSGSLRDSLTNDDWTRKTPFEGEADHEDSINDRWEGTLGGRILRDRLWFFTAGRIEDGETSRNTRDTNLPYTFADEEDRWEIKLTGQLSQSHSVVASYLDREIIQSNNSFGSITDLRSLYDRSLPYTLTTANYNGLLSSNFILDLQWSEREFAFVNSGAQTTDLIDGTILRGFSGSRRAWSPTFCAICGPPKSRDNEYYQVRGSYFLSTDDLGSHNVVAGYEDFSQLRNENNHQGGSGFRLWGNFRHPNGDTFINVDPNESYIQFFPVLQLSETSDGTTKSAYINDKWDLNENWSFNVGVRYDKNESVDQAGATTADDNAFSPRLSATYDPAGDGKQRFSVGYGQYAAAIDNGVNDEASSAGSPASFSWFYTGPEINGPGVPDGSLLPSDVVLTMVFDWFYNVNCPGFEVGSEATIGCTGNLRSTSLPGVSTRIAGSGLKSPTMEEIYLGYSYSFGGQGYIRANYIHREWDDFYTNWTNLETGTVSNALGQVFDLELVGTNATGLSREYDGLQVQGSYRFNRSMSLNGNYTWSELRGNAVGEASNSATDSIGAINNYPEYIDFSWNKPDRALPGDVEHRANLWLTYDLPTSVGNFNFALLQKYHSGYPYYAAGTIDLRAIPNPGYQSAPTTATYFFEGDQAYRTDDITQTDLAINYSVDIRGIELFLQADILNLWDEAGIEDPSSVRQTIYTSRNSACRQADGSRCDRFNPMTTTPIEGVHWQKHPEFGQAVSENAYQLPLTYRFSVGFRF